LLALKAGIGLRAGCHCAHLAIKQILGVGPRLERVQQLVLTLLPGMSLPGLLRISMGIQNTNEEVDLLLDQLRVISAGRKSLESELSEQKFIQLKSEMEKYIRSRRALVFDEAVSE
jgi:hypothetical protein